ncbi:MAG: hypothetical protein ACRDLT_11590 [Solirubrobacteraceae bacterium]
MRAVTDEDFAARVLASDKPAVVDFWAGLVPALPTIVEWVSRQLRVGT